MSEISTQPIINKNGTPLYTYGSNILPANTQNVTITDPAQKQVIYQYPQTSIYNDTNKTPSSGVNIYIYNPSGIGAPNSTSTANATYTLPYQTAPASSAKDGETKTLSDAQPVAAANLKVNPVISNTPINSTDGENKQKTKRIVELTDDYIKSLESYIKSADARSRKTGITELIERFEEDDTRYNDPALIALLNVALQDPVPDNRVLAMSVIAGGKSNGDKNTITLLNKLQKSDKLFGQEAVMANKALLKTAQTKVSIPDYSKDK